jgi:hypothetical protein
MRPMRTKPSLSCGSGTNARPAFHA